MATNRDIAAEALSRIGNIWKVNPARSIPRDDGFDWWPGDFKVSVSAIPMAHGRGTETWMLSVKTDFLKDIPIDNDRFVRLASFAAGVYGTTYAWVFLAAETETYYPAPGASPKLWFANTGCLTSENASWLPRFLAEMSILQPIHAQRASQLLKGLGGGVPDISRNSLLGGSNQQDVLDERLSLYAQAGREINRWLTTDEFEILARGWRALPGSVCRGNDHSFELNLPMDDSPGAIISLTTNQVHPQLGAGLLGNLALPIYNDINYVAEKCASWNFTETMWTGIPQFGSWYPFSLGERDACPQFSIFIPNALYGRGIAGLMVHWLYQRFRAVVHGESPSELIG